MNEGTYLGLLSRLMHRVRLGTRYLGTRPTCRSFGASQNGGSVERVYVINLDRHGQRWGQMRRELSFIRDRTGVALAALTRRFSAIDARHHRAPLKHDEVLPHYSLADQLFVEPNPLLAHHSNASDERVEMSKQEVAVALSHIAVWRLIAAADCQYALVLEDDVYFRSGFARTFERAWRDLNKEGQRPAFDVLYLSYMEARTGAPRRPFSKLLFEPIRGLWQLSGYVLSRRGAQRLLGLLPVRGPVDLWINHQFEELDVLATNRSIIEQRLDCPSANSYSILPILSKVGVLTDEKPLLVETRSLPGPVFAFGEQGSGLTALAMALSMLGYRCCSDIAALPPTEQSNLFRRKRRRVFNAYVNVGSLTASDYLDLALLYRDARFITTHVGSEENLATPQARVLAELRRVSRNVLALPAGHSDKWEQVCRFLGCDYPSDQYPECTELGRRKAPIEGDDLGTDQQQGKVLLSGAVNLKSDSSPWIATSENWHGIRLAGSNGQSAGRDAEGWSSERFEELDRELWSLRDDTFPSNLALFRPGNFSIGTDNVARLTLREEDASVRGFTSAAVCSRSYYLHGRFAAEVKPASVPGLITGVFLHRNSPRQEIDIEFLGKDPTKMLVNVYYNPGAEGTKLEYGYRGTPALVDLGFDASEEFHRYEIEWSATAIRWRVDGQMVHERVNWNPTPIPHLPLQFNVNLWYTRSEELAGRLPVGNLPTQTELRALEVHANY